MNLAVLLSGVVFDSQKALMRGIEKSVQKFNDVCSVFCCHVNVFENDLYGIGEYKIFDLPDFNNYDGVIFVRNTFKDQELTKSISDRIKEARKPCVCIDGIDDDFVNLCNNEYEATIELVEHLIKIHDCKSFAFIGGTVGGSDSEARYAGFREALSINDISYDEDNFYLGNYEFRDGVEAVKYFVERNEKMVDAIVCANDQMAVGAISQLSREGFKVPRDVKVVGIDYDFASRAMSPSLTTFERPQYEKGQQSVEILHSFASYKKGEVINSETKIKIYESCGCSNRRRLRFSEGKDFAEALYEQAELTQVVKRMSAGLMSQNDYGNLISYMEDYALSINPQELYLCLNDRPAVEIDYIGYSEAVVRGNRKNERDYTDDIKCIINISDGKCISEEVTYNRKKLFPPNLGRKEGVTYYFYPVNYLDRNFGYAILGGTGSLIRNDFFPNWVTLVGNALENFRKKTIMEQMINTLDRMWIYDTLTGIYNRAGFYKLCEPLVSESRSKGAPLAVYFLDVDGLKQVNDAHGHDAGDELIKEVASILKEQLEDKELIMRYGGDEFVILSPKCSKTEVALRIEKIENAFKKRNETRYSVYNISASIGHYVTRIADVEDLTACVEEADKEMYKMKKAKKEKVLQS